jgi:hypothetical protein
VIEEITRAVIVSATTGERRFVACAARIDSTVVEADIRYPTDLGLAADATKALAREATAVGKLAGQDAPRVRDRSRAVGQRLRKLNRTLAARTGQGKPTASATSNAATACTAAASKATAERRPGPPGRSSPTTSTRSPSEPAETLPSSGTTRPDTTRNTETAATHPSAAVLTPTRYRGK